MIANIALSLSMIQLLFSVRDINKYDITNRSITYTLVGLAASFFWFLHYALSGNFNSPFMLYMGGAFVLQIYVLARILDSKRRVKAKTI